MVKAKQVSYLKRFFLSKAHSPYANISSRKPSLGSGVWMGLTTHLQCQGRHMTEGYSMQGHQSWDILCRSGWKRQSISSGLVASKMWTWKSQHQGQNEGELRNRDWTLLESFEALHPIIPNLTRDSGLHEQLNIFLGLRIWVHSLSSSCIGHFLMPTIFLAVYSLGRWVSQAWKN